MNMSRSFGGFGSSFTYVGRTLSQWFPRPRLLAPRAVGIDISDASIKWIILENAREGKRVHSYGQEALPQGTVVNGLVQDANALAVSLSAMKAKLGGVDCAHAALPEEAAYVFSMHAPDASSREQILSMIEFEFDDRVPIPVDQAVYDFDVIQKYDSAGSEIGVVVFPRELAERYFAAFSRAGIHLLSLEVEASSIARAVSSPHADEPITLLVDFGRLRTGFAVLKHGVPIFTSTVTVGGDTIDRAVAERLKLSPEDAEVFKNDQGLLAEGGTKAPGMEALIGTATALADEVARHYHYWDTRRNERGERMTPVEQVFLLGGSANLKGLGDYIAARVQAKTTRPDVWRNVCSFDDYIPPIDRRMSLQFATAIGLALRSS